MTTTREAQLEAALKPFADIGIGTDPDYQPMIRMNRDAVIAARAALSTPATEPQGLVENDTIDSFCLTLRRLVSDAYAERDRFGHIAATIHVNALHHGATNAEVEAMLSGEISFVNWIADKVEARPAPQPAAEHEYPDPLIAEDRYDDDQPAADTPALDDELATMISDLSHTGELSMLYRMEIADRITALRAALDAAEARAVGVPSVVARGVVRDTSDPSGRTMYVLFNRAMSDDEMRDWHDRVNALHPASPLGAVATDSFDQLIAESKAAAIRAMIKYPQPNYVISKVAEEAGEVVKAAIHCAEGRETPENVIGEMRQTIAMLYRLWVEGDQVHGLAAIAPFARKGE